jgi:hypothetical protein
MNDDILLKIILLCLNIFFFGLGYLYGKLYSIVSPTINSNQPKSFFDKQTPQQKIEIDDKKYVGNIKTDGIEKKYVSLGETTKSDDNIVSSVDKLKNLKK